MWNLWPVRTGAGAISSNGAQTNRIQNDALLSELGHDLAVTRVILLTAFAIGLLTVFLMWVVHVIQHGYVAFFWALACFATGSLVGFLFGIPRVFQGQAGSDGMRGNAMPGADSLAGGSGHHGYQLVINTHLDDISDWLTKIAVGVGLVELEKMPRLVYHLSSVIAGGLAVASDPSSVIAFVMALLVYFTTAGFMSGYLTTRMFFQRAFRIADLHAMGSDHERMVKKTEVVQTEERSSAGAH
jgi:hypothetical protein